MREKVIAKRYAKALFELSVESGDFEAVAGDLSLLDEAAKNVPVFIKAFSDDRFEIKKRLLTADKIAAVLKIGKKVCNMWKLLIERSRLSLINFIVLDFMARLETHKRLAVACAVVADAQVSTEVKNRIEKIMTGALGLKSRCDVGVQAEILGGVEVRIGSMRYDASVRGRLTRMKEKLL